MDTPDLLSDRLLPWMVIGLVGLLVDDRYGEAIRAVCKRQPGESMQAAWLRGLAARARHHQAHSRMLGSPRVTFLACVATLYSWLGLTTLCLDESWLAIPAFSYYAVGIVVAAKLDLSRHPSWQLVRGLDRAFWLGTHAWLWPWHLWRR